MAIAFCLMAILSMIKSVCSGSSEFFSGDVDLSTGHYIDFEFNDELTIDDILINVTSGSADDKFAVRILYPSSGQEATIATFSAVTPPTAASPLSFFLNATEGIGHAGTGKLWFRIPARGHLILVATLINTTAKANMVVLGRSGM